MRLHRKAGIMAKKKGKWTGEELEVAAEPESEPVVEATQEPAALEPERPVSADELEAAKRIVTKAAQGPNANATHNDRSPSSAPGKTVTDQSGTRTVD
jgi:hypothetical protein